MTYVYQAELFTRRIMKCCNAYRHTHKKISWESADRTTLSGIALHCSMHDDGYSRRINFGGSIIQMAQTSVVQEVRSLRGMDIGRCIGLKAVKSSSRGTYSGTFAPECIIYIIATMHSERRTDGETWCYNSRSYIHTAWVVRSATNDSEVHRKSAVPVA